MIDTYPDFQSKSVRARNVEIWLPPDYSERPEIRFPVLYMHDGQNVFNPDTSTLGVDWGVDETMEKLTAEGKVRPAVVVAVWSTESRSAEYMPKKPVEQFGVSAEFLRSIGTPVSDAYLRFLVEELKPFVDRTYRTMPGREDTVIMGSSMGGLISLYAVMEYREVFGGAGCVSTHWPAGEGVMIKYMKLGLPDPQTHKVYFDYGTKTVDRAYEPYQQLADEVMEQAGYTQGVNWITRKFPGAEHSERAWRRRVDLPLVFLLGPPDSTAPDSHPNFRAY